MSRPDEVRDAPAPRGGPDTATAACPTDLSIKCPVCEMDMQPEHAHYRCLRCGYRDSCCM